MATAIYLQNGPLADLGITYSTMNDLDGLWIFFVPVILVCFLVWLGLGLLLRYFFHGPGGRWFWPISAAAVAAPFVILLITTNVMARLT